MKIGVLASGSGSNLQTLIDQLHYDESCEIEIAVVISDRKKAYALTRAKNAEIPSYVVKAQDFPDRHAFDERISKLLDRHAVELIVLAGFMKLLQ
ncbi:MAG: formyltransferase family protein, partial [Candidatus Poribacteria bacterium]|nr:formyltransferase family protein [Candidatus Poribacteria bacterium]